MSYYGKGFGRFGQYKSKKPTKYEGLTKKKETNTPINKKAEVRKAYARDDEKMQKKSLSQIFERDVEAKKESLIKKGYTPRGKDILREVNAYMNNHPLREDYVFNKKTLDRTKTPAKYRNNRTNKKLTEKERTRFLEFRQAKINALKKEKKDG